VSLRFPAASRGALTLTLDSMKKSSSTRDNAATRTLWFSLIVVAVSTAAMPFIKGLGTVLSLVVKLNAWTLFASATSSMYADQHHQFLWPIAAILNVALFSLVAVPSYFVFRRRASNFTLAFLALWLIFYLCCLFFLFPATHGP
jgi:hypothetical protein